MELEKRKLSELKENPINIRRHNQNQINEFKKSITAFGTIRPIVIDEGNMILAGHGLYMALNELGKDEADVVVMRGLSERDKKKLLLSDNKIYSLGIDNYTAIESILKELAMESDFEVPGYDPEILEDLYGIRSVEKEVENKEQFQIPDDSEQEFGGIDKPKETLGLDFVPEPSKRIQEQREEVEQRKFVICPSCGEKIWL